MVYKQIFNLHHKVKHAISNSSRIDRFINKHEITKIFWNTEWLDRQFGKVFWQNSELVTSAVSSLGSN